MGLMTLSAYLIGTKKENIILCIQEIPNEGTIKVNGTTIEKLSPTAIKDYNKARDHLKDLANHNHVTVTNDINEALRLAITQVQDDEQEKYYLERYFKINGRFKSRSLLKFL